MAKQITFPGKERREEAKEYARMMEARGWKVMRPYFDQAQGAWVVQVSELREGERREVPTTPGEVIALEEKEATWVERQKRQFREGRKQMGEGAVQVPREVVTGFATGRSLRPALEHTRQRRSFDVVAGMKRAIPRVAEREEVPKIGRIGAARIAQEPYVKTPSGRIPIGETGLGVGREARFRTNGMRFQVPRVGKLKTGHPAIENEEREEAI